MLPRVKKKVMAGHVFLFRQLSQFQKSPIEEHTLGVSRIDACTANVMAPYFFFI